MRKLMFVALAVLAFTGCGGQEAPKATPTATATAAAGGGYSKGVMDYYGDAEAHPEAEPGSIEDVESEYHQPPKPAEAGVGETITLTGTNIGVRLEVTVKSVERVSKYLAVNLEFESTGITNFESAFEQAAVTYAGGEQRKPVEGASADCIGDLVPPPTTTFIPVGAKASGCLLFPTSGDEEPERFQLALETVPTEAGGIWNLR